MSGKKGRSGRRPAPKTLIDQMLARSEPHLPEIWEGLVDLAKGVRIGTLKEDGEMVNVYSKPPDKEAIAEITSRHFGRPRIELDQRLKTEVEMDPARMLQAHREALAYEAEWLLASPERQLPSPTREASYAPVLELDITAPFESDVAEGRKSDVMPTLANLTDLVGIPPALSEDRGCVMNSPPDPPAGHDVDGIP